jgi:hypothetical protein
MKRPNSARGYNHNLTLIEDPSGDYKKGALFTKREIQVGARNWEPGTRFEDSRNGAILVIREGKKSNVLEEEECRS